MNEEPDIRLQVRVKNARICRAMERAGIKSAAELCRRLGFTSQKSFVTVGELINFKASPLLKDGNWRTIAMDIATALHLEPEELWPEYLRRVEAKRTETYIDVTVEQFGAIAGGDASLLIKNSAAKYLTACSPREQRVIEMRFGLNGEQPLSLDEVGKACGGVTAARARQIEMKAIRKMNLVAAEERDRMEHYA